MGLFKRAAVRGIAYELVKRGSLSFLSKQALDEAADLVADKGVGAKLPEMSPEGGHPPEDVAMIAEQLIQLGEQLKAEAAAGGPPPGAAGMPPGVAGPEAAPPMPPEMAAKLSAELTKSASEISYEAAAQDAAELCMQKAANEVKAASSLVEGGDHKNTPAAAAQTDTVAKLDEKNRPQGKYHEGAGQTSLETRSGHVGTLEANPVQPSNSPSGSNSLTKDEHKSASLDAAIAKLASSLIQGNDKHNTAAAAAQTDTVAKLDRKNRPDGAYVVGQGGANFKEPQAARVGTEQPHPKAPANSPSGTNSVIQASKAAEDLSADDQAFVTLFGKTAADVGAYLPSKLSDEAKTAAIRHMVGLDHAERQTYLDGLHKTASGGDISAMMASLNRDEHKESAKDEKAEKALAAEKKASFQARLTEIAKQASTATA